jgi:cyclopropane fatty-acyl-phospholipid synthase-like methyltransferase
MMTRTRKRIARVCGETAAQDRVRAGVMEDLSEFEDGSFDLIVALGIYHQALTFEHWQECVAESARVLKEGGLVLISAFTPGSQPEGKALQPVKDLENMYGGFSSGPLCLFEAHEHDAQMANHGFEPHVPTETVRVETELGFRITVNALYRKCGKSA